MALVEVMMRETEQGGWVAPERALWQLSFEGCGHLRCRVPAVRRMACAQDGDRDAYRILLTEIEPYT
jgi:hypothetical protein